MKSMIAFLLLVGAIFLAPCAKGQKVFYYYPAQNVYFNVDSREYLFQKDGKWQQDKMLPPLYHVNKKERVCIVCDNTDILNDSSFQEQIARSWENKSKKVADTTHFLIRIDHDRS